MRVRENSLIPFINFHFLSILFNHSREIRLILGAAFTTVGEKKRCKVFTRTPGIELAECAVKCKELSSTAFAYGSTDKMCACYTEKYVDVNCLHEISPSIDLYKITAGKIFLNLLIQSQSASKRPITYDHLTRVCESYLRHLR